MLVSVIPSMHVSDDWSFKYARYSLTFWYIRDSRSLASRKRPSPRADCSVRRIIGGIIGSRLNMLSAISGVVVGVGCGMVLLTGGMMGVFSFW